MIEILIFLLVAYVVMRFRKHIAMGLSLIIGWISLAFWWGVFIAFIVWLFYEAKEEEREESKSNNHHP